MTIGTIGASRIGALLIAAASAGMATHAAHDTQRFIRAAQPGTGRILVAADQDGPATIGVRTRPDRPETRSRADGMSDQPPGATVPVLYVARFDGTLDIRIGPERLLWRRVWTWVEVAFAALLAAIYGQALIQDPLSVIGFKRWRIFGRSSGKRERT